MVFSFEVFQGLKEITGGKNKQISYDYFEKL